MMFGTREHFEYVRCGDCNTLQIASIPADLGSAYPEGYYSFAAPPPSMPDWIKSRVATMVFLGGREWLARMVPPLRRWRAEMPEWLFHVPGLKRSHAILDVGSGGGALLSRLADGGFTRLHGIDPYLQGTVADARISVRKAELGEIDDKYDLVTMHHALEHVADPRATLADLRRIVKPGGHVVISIPVSQGQPYRDYRANWVHLDAPRHLCLFTVEGLTETAVAQGFKVDHIGFDTTMFTIAGSRLYAQDIPLYEPDGRSNLDRFSPADKAGMSAEAARLNATGDADTAYFVLSLA